jgi:hypothetical protein
MRKPFLLLMLFMAFLNKKADAQTYTDIRQIPGIEYYIFISGVKTHADITKIENSIKVKKGVTFFMSNQIPVRYFLLKTTSPVTVQEFSSWIDDPSFKVEFFGEGEESMEKAMDTGKKFNKKS